MRENHFHNISCLYTYSDQFQENQVFLRGCKWSSNNLNLAANDSSSTLRILRLHDDFTLNNHDADYHLKSLFCDVIKIKPGSYVYDFDWGPCLSDDAGQSLLTIGKLGPIHLWDVRNKTTKSYYMMYNENDEVTTGVSVTYAPNSKIYAGARGAVYIFDIERPGRDCDKVKDQYFKRGIVSAISINPFKHSLFAVGTYNKRIGLYDEGSLLCTLNGLPKGVTSLKFSTNGVFLYSGMRGDGNIICWDLRNPGTALYKMTRVVNTQQRIYFDFAKNGQFIISGSTDGKVFIWDVNGEVVDETLLPIKEFTAHSDCTNGISFNERFSILATCSGQYHHDFPISDDDEDNNDNILSSKKAFDFPDYSIKLWS